MSLHRPAVGFAGPALACLVGACALTPPAPSVIAPIALTVPTVEVYELRGVVRAESTQERLAGADLELFDGERLVGGAVTSTRGAFVLAGYRAGDAPPGSIDREDLDRADIAEYLYFSGGGRNFPVAVRHDPAREPRHRHWVGLLVVRAPGYARKELTVPLPLPLGTFLALRLHGAYEPRRSP